MHCTLPCGHNGYSPDQRTCNTCGETEDEIHCIMRCKLKTSEREKTFTKLSLHNKRFDKLDETEKFIFLQQRDHICDQNIFQFITKCLKNSYAQNETT